MDVLAQHPHALSDAVAHHAPLATGVGLPCSVQNCGDQVYRATLDPALRREQAIVAYEKLVPAVGAILAYLFAKPGMKRPPRGPGRARRATTPPVAVRTPFQNHPLVARRHTAGPCTPGGGEGGGLLAVVPQHSVACGVRDRGAVDCNPGFHGPGGSLGN